MTEAEVVTAFAACLVREGWAARTEVDHVDVLAERGEVTLLAEAKGQTSSTGLDADTPYGAGYSDVWHGSSASRQMIKRCGSARPGRRPDPSSRSLRRWPR